MLASGATDLGELRAWDLCRVPGDFVANATPWVKRRPACAQRCAPPAGFHDKRAEWWLRMNELPSASPPDHIVRGD